MGVPKQENLESVRFSMGASITEADIAAGRLPPERYVRSWNEASFWSAVVAFGPLCIPVHFIRTRRSLVGALLGVAWMAGVLVVLSVVGELLAAILD